MLRKPLNIRRSAPAAVVRWMAMLCALGTLGALSGCVEDAVKPHAGYLGAGAKDTSSDADGEDPDSQDTNNHSGDAGTIACSTNAECANKLTDVPECAIAVCGKDGVCAFANAPKNTPCEGSKCMQNAVCNVGKCGGGVPVTCTSDSPCTSSVCDEASGKCAETQKKDGVPCDDGTACTPVSACVGGVCKGENTKCQCVPDALAGCWGRLNMDSADKCAGAPVCEPYTAPGGVSLYKCSKNLASVIICGTSKDSACVKNTCAPKTGLCGMLPVSDGATCDDGVSCTLSDHCVKGKCQATTDTCQCSPSKGTDLCYGGKPTQVDITKGDKCAGDVFCEALYDASTKQLDYKCSLNLSTVVSCPTAQDTACLKNTCDANNGNCSMQPVTQPSGSTKVLCDDANPCTKNDACDAATHKCVGGVSVCKCATQADCASEEDGNLCNGTLYCDEATGTCKLNQATKVVCPSGADTACLVNYCFPAKGTCAMTPRENLTITQVKKQEMQSSGFIKLVPTGEVIVSAYDYKVIDYYCDDGNPCTPSDACSKGKCMPGPVSTCSCQVDLDCNDEEDGDACNGTLYCDKALGTCKLNPTSIVTCPTADGNTCAASSCDKKTGKCTISAVADGKICDDDNPCTASDTCQKGKCQPGTMVCQCQKNADCMAYDDGNLCNGTAYCDLAAEDTAGNPSPACRINPATVVHCSSSGDTTCLKNACVPKTGQCVKQAVNTYHACDAGNPCYASPVCLQGKCSWESNLCACATDADCAYIIGPKDDPNLCFGTPYCDKTKGVCKLSTASVPVCVGAKGDACNDWKCDPTSGKCAYFAKSSFTPCSDQQPCTVGDTCSKVSGSDKFKPSTKKAVCSSGTDICQCNVTADCALYDDGDKCNGTLTCVSGKCQPTAAPPSCSQPTGNTCMVSACDKKTGKCASKTDLGKCDDNNPCTMDTCEGPSCKHAKVAAGSACVDAQTGVGVCVDDATKLSVCQPPPLQNVRLVPASVVQMGCNVNPSQSPCTKAVEKPQHAVDVGGFWIQRFEVTAADYAACVTAGKCTAPAKASATNGCTYGDAKLANHPINCVSWSQAKSYCGFVDSTGRLPTEAEWEKAARGGCELFNACAKNAFRYVWGDAPEPTCANAVHDSVANGPGCGEGGPVPVGKLLKGDESLYGVNDLAGNVSEWVGDFYAAAWYSDPGATTANTTGPAAAASKDAERVIRGGSWADKATPTANRMRISWRGHHKPNNGTNFIGFRCVVPLK